MTKFPKTKKKTSPAKGNTRAKLDGDGVLVGFADDGNGPEVPAECDLALNRYRWNAEAERFDPLPRPEKNHKALTTRALVGAVVAIRNWAAETGHDITFPPETETLLKIWEKTGEVPGFDGKEV